jgi:hypothetical protein
VSVLIQDAETKQPIADAKVHSWYPGTQSAVGPDEEHRETGKDGIAHLNLSPYGDGGVLLEATATGYMEEEKALSVAEVQAIEPAHWFEKVERRPVNYVIELYAEPHPTVELVIPPGYRGRIEAEIRAEPNIPCPPHQRQFTFVAAPPAVVQVAGPPMFRFLFPQDFQAKYADGIALNQEVNGEDVGFWWIKCDGRYVTFLVGTKAEYDRYRRSAATESGSHDRSSGGGKGQGQGRHGGRHGGQQLGGTDPGG